MIVLDTSFLIDFFKDETLADILPSDEQAAVTVISYYEIMAGVHRLRAKRETAFFHAFFASVDILDFTLPAADIASMIGANMSAEGNRVNAFDILIAGIALTHHAPVIITADTDFTAIAKYADIEVRAYRR
ncbi:MAG: hypothetical protein STSR0009_00030 [Methanoregula sp.]